MLADYCDVVFCNAEEVRRFTEEPDLEQAALQIGQWVRLAFVTDGPHGCLVVRGKHLNHVAGFQVRAIDRVGAGDAFAGGVLFGLTHGYSPVQAARWGNYLASRVVTVHGARLPHSMADQLERVMDVSACM